MKPTSKRNDVLVKLEEAHKDITTLMMALAEVKSETRIEINHLKAAVERAFLDIRAADKRVTNIEKISHKQQQQNIHVRFPLLDFFRRYWHVLAIIGSIISFILSYFFGFKIKSDG